MKMTNRLIILTAMLLALASCSKEVPEENPSAVSSDGEGREIALAFSGSTKANLDGLTPVFAAGDKILLSNDSETETCTVKTRNGKAFIITHLSGPLDAVFPASAAKVEGNQITGFKVPSFQNGRFSDAIISMAENITGNHATFDCKVPILKFYADIDVVDIRTLRVQGTGVASDGNPINVPVASYDIFGNPDPRLCYVAVMPGINANTLTFTSTGYYRSDIVKRCTTDTELQAGHTYNAFIPYYIDMGAAGKWGYCNVGAFLPEEYGWYFSWGNVDAYVKAPDYWVSAADGSQFTGGFSSANYKSSSGYTLSTNIPETAQYDAACAYWGEGWRMPTGGPYASAEFVALFNACREEGYTSGEVQLENITTVPTTQGVYFYNVSSGSKGLYFVNAEGTKLFFPYAGYGTGNVRYAGGVYWSSTIYSGNACALDWVSTTVKPRTYYTGTYGGSIRPVYNGGTGLENEGYDDEGEY